MRTSEHLVFVAAAVLSAVLSWAVEANTYNSVFIGVCCGLAGLAVATVLPKKDE